MAASKEKPTRFPDTRWSLVGRAAASDAVVRLQALEELLSIYSPGFRTFLIQARHIAPDEADELVQAFVADKVLAAQLVRHADQQRGKFRNFVLKSLNNFATTRRRGQMRPGGSLESAHDAAEQLQFATADVFDRQWVQQVVADALHMMASDCESRGRADMWEILRLRVVEPVFRGAEPLGYEQIVQLFGFDSPRQAMNLLASAKRCFLDHLRLAISKYVEENRIEEELADLRRIVAH